MADIVKNREAENLLTKQPGLESLKASLSIAPVLAFLEKFDAFTKKKKMALGAGEVLFSPGENPYFYVVASGALKIFRINPTGEKKEIGKAFAGSFIGEGVLSDRLQKEVQAEAYVDSVIVKLTKEDLEFLESQSPETLMKLYKHINNLTSLRLSDTGKELALLYEATEKVNAFKENGDRGFLEGITLLKQTLSLDYVIAIERHPVVPDILVYKYNTKFPSVYPVNQKVGEEVKISDDGRISIEPGQVLGTSASDAIQILPLKSGESVRGVLILGKKGEGKKFGDYELRISENLAPLFASMVENNQRIADEKAKAMSRPVY